MKSISSDPLPSPIVESVTIADPALTLPNLSHQSGLAFLDSAMRSPQLGRYSFLGCSPFGTFKTVNGKAFWNDLALHDTPFVALQKKLNTYRTATLSGDLPPFQGGAIGYIAYEAGRLLEKLPTTRHEDARLDDIRLNFYDLVLAVDHFPLNAKTNEEHAAWIFSSGFPKSGDERDLYAKERLEWLKAELINASKAESKVQKPPAIKGWISNFSRIDFEKAVDRTKTYILNGDIFQANITQRFTARLPEEKRTTPMAYYQNLRTDNAAPFAAYLDCDDHIIASSSPERFITLDSDGHVETRPIKGTAPRDLTDEKQDQLLADALAKSEKDRAENVMITDLMRNDLSRVCQAGSIKVPTLCQLESYARVHHLVSTVKGQMKQGTGAIALLGASFPGGSITGAPKIRAMEIISELEDLPRGVYCGSIGYIGFNGTMDTNIAIRTLTFKDGLAHFSVGGGITILSDPSQEYEETLHKAAAIFRSLGTSVQNERSGLEIDQKVSETGSKIR